MTYPEKENVALIAVAAAFCDGRKSEAEREKIRELLGNLDLPGAATLVQRVLLNKAPLETTTAALSSPESRALAYEMAVCIVEADGHRDPEEERFLTRLGELLALSPTQASQTLQTADTFAAAGVLPVAEQVLPPPLASTPASAPPPAPAPDLEPTIRKTAILAGALELLPQSVATLAVLPLQTHLVYRVGKAHGYTLDAGHVKEFLGVLGLGLASQAFEGMARKFLGGLVKRAGGGLAGSLTSAAAGPVITFATTYAIGQLAQRYYGGGRTLSALQLKETFQQLVGSAKAQGERFLPEMRTRASGLNLAELPSLIRGV
ncbi:MAG: TerB family tellurite resistance protein [Verrucomicrobia bacterium]|nr:TerB family tellurite resistance protein [Verrucomicrobiota bacterium]